MTITTGIVVTSIGDGRFLDYYLPQIDAENVKDSVCIYVIPDKNSSVSLYERCRNAVDQGYMVKYVPLEHQLLLVRRLELENIIPYNSDNRRNIGYLMAYKDGVNVIVSIDDDNYCMKDSKFFADHGSVGQESTLRIRETTTGWYNVCTDLGIPQVFPRGFPYQLRDLLTSFRETNSVSRKVMINAGLWVGDPDLDSITLISGKKKARLFNGKSFLLGDRTWTPISSQNTAVHRDALVSYYFLPMNTTVRGLEMDRYGDIFSGYFAQACVKHMGHIVRIGTPIVDHQRNRHDYWHDINLELPCIEMTEYLTMWLTNAKLEGSTYTDTYLSLASQLEDVVESFTGRVWTVDAKSYFHRSAYCMRKWARAIGRLSS